VNPICLFFGVAIGASVTASLFLLSRIDPNPDPQPDNRTTGDE